MCGLTTPKLHLRTVESKTEGGSGKSEVKAIDAAIEELQGGQKKKCKVPKGIAAQL